MRKLPLALACVFALTSCRASSDGENSHIGNGGESAEAGGIAGHDQAGSGGAGGPAGLSGGTGGGGPDGGGDAGMAPGGAGGTQGQGGNTNRTADSVWSALTVMAVVNPKDHGASGNGTNDDQNALSAAVNALPAEGGIVYLPEGSSFKKTNLLIITRAHVKFWAPNRQADIFQSIAGQTRRQSILCRNNTGCGFFGVKFRSDAVARFDALEDNQISADHGSLVEVVGCEIQGSAASGVFLYGSTEHYIEGNYIHHTWADHIHHTEGAKQSWVWGNFILNDNPSKGDDGVACVTYGPASTRCSDMEWWRNTILHTGWGRGYSVIGGDNVNIHHNWAIGVAGAGIIVASESSYNSANSNGITIANNNVYQCGHTIGHPGILISGLNNAAQPLSNISLSNNVSADNVSGVPYRAEGAFTNVTNVSLATTNAALEKPIPGNADIKMADTAILRTRDVSHVAANQRPGLYRIHVRKAPGANGFQERFEYIVKGPAAAIADLVTARAAAGDYLSEQRSVGDTTYALVLSSAPFTIPGTVSPVTFRELRTGDQGGALSWLWQRVDSGSY